MTRRPKPFSRLRRKADARFKIRTETDKTQLHKRESIAEPLAQNHVMRFAINQTEFDTFWGVTSQNSTGRLDLLTRGIILMLIRCALTAERGIGAKFKKTKQQ